MRQKSIYQFFPFFGQALKAVLKSLKTPFALTEDDFKENSGRSDRFILGVAKTYTAIFLILMALTNALMAVSIPLSLMLGAGLGVDLETGKLWIGTNIIVCLMAYAAWRGLDADYPWLRITLLGRLISTVVAASPFVLIYINPNAPYMILFSLLTTSFLLILWHQYWSVQRPLHFRRFKL